jgi:hypothetical protein
MQSRLVRAEDNAASPNTIYPVWGILDQGAGESLLSMCRDESVAFKRANASGASQT